jgi:hypothetical protein
MRMGSLDRRWFKICAFLFFFFLLLLFSSACTTTRYVTHTKKSGMEQLLISKSLDNALQGTRLDVKGVKIFLDVTSLVSDENAYIKKALEHWFLKNGATLSEDRKDAEYIASVLVKCAGTDGNEFKFGVPSVPIPLFNVMTPEISFISGSIQKGYAELEVILYGSDTGEKEGTEPLVGQSYFKKYSIFFIPFSSQNIY